MGKSLWRALSQPSNGKSRGIAKVLGSFYIDNPEMSYLMLRCAKEYGRWYKVFFPVLHIITRSHHLRLLENEMSYSVRNGSNFVDGKAPLVRHNFHNSSDDLIYRIIFGFMNPFLRILIFF